MPALIAKDLLVALVEKEGMVIPKLGQDDHPDSITQANILAEMYKIILREVNKTFQQPKRTIV